MKAIKGIFVLSTVLFSAHTLALPFMAYDPRTLGMGGTSVSAANSTTAALYNPALLSAANKDDDFSITLPTLGVRVADADELAQAVTDFNDADYVGKFDAATDTTSDPDRFNPILPGPVPNPNFAANVTNAISAAQNVLTGIQTLSNKTIEAQIGAGTLISIPSRNFGFALVASGTLGGGVVGDVTAEDLAQINAQIAELEAALIGSTAPDLTLFDPNAMTTNIQARFGLIQEYGLAISKEYEIGEADYAFGITPKVVKMQTIDYKLVGSALDQADINIETGLTEYSDFNLDFGVAHNYNDEYRAGLVIKNLIPKSYKTVLGNTIKVNPAVRIGGSMHGAAYNVAADLDLTENDPLGLGGKSRYLSLGTELDLWLLKVQLGYRYNISDSDASIMTAGLGLNLGLDVEVAGAMNPSGNEYGVAARVGFSF
ncbi:MAG: conjugal transfer protein TraF [Gammaproteobacteria bacterium]|nr:conjugal transfer protein TraF [Gammaproteobacteria bacterium]